MKNWDNYFYEICETVSLHSKCLSRKLGAIIVKDKSIISTGFNGPPRSIPHCDDPSLWEFRHEYLWFRDKKVESQIPISAVTSATVTSATSPICPRREMGFKSGEGLEWCIAAHAERNALINAARMGISVKGATIFVIHFGVPCKDCFIEIINAGITEIVCEEISFYDDLSKYLARTSGVAIRTFELK